MSYTKASADDVGSKIPEENGGMYFLKDALETEELGFTVLELAPGKEGMAHDHANEGQEEIYYVESGAVTVDVDGEAVDLEEGEAIRVSPDATRRIVNGDERSRLVLVGAPAR